MHFIDFTMVKYAMSAHYAHQCPKDHGMEIAFVGRSNVGKSSAINTITNQNKLAKTSKIPGRTQQCIFFSVTGNIRLVDLPGYGYTKVPKTLRDHWKSFLTTYVVTRKCLKAVMMPMDIRHPLTTLDRIMLKLCGDIGLPVHILLTKVDKLNRGIAVNIFNSVSHELRSNSNITVQFFSALKKIGVNQARQVINKFIQTN